MLKSGFVTDVESRQLVYRSVFLPPRSAVDELEPLARMVAFVSDMQEAGPEALSIHPS